MRRTSSSWATAESTPCPGGCSDRCRRTCPSERRVTSSSRTRWRADTETRATAMPPTIDQQRGSRKVVVLGPIPRDQIVTHTGERFEKYGCALYTAVALSALLDPGDTIVPIAHVRRRDAGPIKKILSAYRNIDTSGITSSYDQGDVVELRYIQHNR